MSVREYIGARYVPKFYEFNNGVWESNKEYEPLTIVQYNSNSYTSKKTVPANIGNPNENPDYWVVTGNYNAQVEEYKQDVQNLDNRVDHIDTQIEGINGQVRGINEQIDVIDAELSKKMLKKKYIFIGDSYGEGVGPGSDISYGWCQLVPQYMGLSSDDYYSFYLGGSGFARPGYKWLDLLRTNSASITNKNEITDICVFGGYNDNNYLKETILNEIKLFCEYAKSTFPNARVKIGMVGWGTTESARAGISNNVTPAYSLCGRYGASYISGSEYILHNYTYISSDAIHPTTDGYVRLASYISSGIISGAINVNDNYNNTTIRANGISTSVEYASEIAETFNNGTIQICNTTPLSTIRFNFNNATLEGGGIYDIGVADLIFTKPFNGGYTSDNFVTGFIYDGTDFKKFEGQLGIRPSGVLFIRNITIGNTGGYVGFNNAQYLCITFPIFTFNSKYC